MALHGARSAALATALACCTLAGALLLAPSARAAQDIRFEGTAFELPEDWTVNPNTRPGIWQVQRRFEEGRDRSAALTQVVRPIPASEGPFDAVFARLAASIPGLDRERPTI